MIQENYQILKMKVICLISLILGCVAATRHHDDEMLFVFEMVRHGARAPIQDFHLDDFKVAEGMLTASGMRQRYLLG